MGGDGPIRGFPQKERLQKFLSDLLRDRFGCSVRQEMIYCRPLCLAAVAGLISTFGVAFPVASEELPSGTSIVFREKMQSWKTAEIATIPVIVRVDPKATGERMKLPRLSSRFGYREHPILGRRALHAGIDIPGPLGTPVRASESGIVRFAGRAGGYGAMVEIDHGNGLRTRYAHLSRMTVRDGTLVRRGETIGLMGSTGLSTGSHLHFEVRVHGRPADPLDYLDREDPGFARSFLVTRRAIPSEPYVSAYARARVDADQTRGAGL